MRLMVVQDHLLVQYNLSPHIVITNVLKLAQWITVTWSSKIGETKVN